MEWPAFAIWHSASIVSSAGQDLKASEYSCSKEIWSMNTRYFGGSSCLGVSTSFFKKNVIAQKRG